MGESLLDVISDRMLPVGKYTYRAGESLLDTTRPETRSTDSQIESKRVLAARGSVSIKVFVTKRNGATLPHQTSTA
jgi:hypothetical protein